METQCVLCAVESELLNYVWMNVRRQETEEYVLQEDSQLGCVTPKVISVYHLCIYILLRFFFTR